MFTRLTAIAASITCALALAACSSSDSGGGDSTPEGGTIKLMAMGPTDAPNFSLPGIPVGAQQAVDDINSTGGVNGRKLELIVCNDKNDPNTASQCARQAIKDEVVAIVGGLTLFDPQINPILERAGIPWIGSTSGIDFSSKNLYFVNGDAGAGWVGLGLAMGEEGCKNYAIVASATSSPSVIEQLNAGGEAAGMNVVGTFTAPANSADWAPTVAALRAKGADCIGSGTGPAESGALVAAVRAVDKDVKLGFSSGGLPAQLVTQLKEAGEGIIQTSGYYPFSSDKGDIQTLAKELQAKDPKAPLDTFTLSGNAAVKIVVEAAKNLDDVTAASLTKALSGVKGFDTGLGPVVDFSTPNPAPGFERIFNPLVFKVKVENGVQVLASDTPIDAGPGLKLIKSS